MASTIKPYQVKGLIIAARAIYDQLASAGATSESFDEWRADLCQTVTGQPSFRAVTYAHLGNLQRILNVPAAPRPASGRRLAKGQYYLKCVLKETKTSTAMAREMCRRLFDHADLDGLNDADARKLGHILQRKKST